MEQDWQGATKAVKCSRCRRRYRGHGDWNVVGERGRIVAALCPSCQTPEENAEAEINAATLTYVPSGDGLVRAVPRSDVGKGPSVSAEEAHRLFRDARSALMREVEASHRRGLTEDETVALIADRLSVLRQEPGAMEAVLSTVREDYRNLCG